MSCAAVHRSLSTGKSSFSPRSSSSKSMETKLLFSTAVVVGSFFTDFEKIQKEQPLELPSKPPQRRNWMGSMVAPFAGNNMLVLYSCPSESSSKYLVQEMHNEHPVPMPEMIVASHLKHDYNTLCNLKIEKPERMPITSKLWQIFRWLFPQRSNATESAKQEL